MDPNRCEIAREMLIVDDDPSLRQALASEFENDGYRIVCCGSIGDALATLELGHPDLLLLDLSLPDGDAFDVLDAIGRSGRMPAIVAMSGVASPIDGFRLAQLGTVEFLSKPFSTDELRTAVERAISEPRNLKPHLRNVVGHLSVQDVEAQLRSTMVEEALARSDGSRKRAAALLGVSRQVLQFILRKRK
jgi:two-component system, response regulator RegA